MTRKLIARFMVIVLLILFLHPLPASSYGTLAHEAIIDALWAKSLKPLLQQKYPRATEEELKKAHACMYGGAIIFDIGYYPLGSRMFSNLAHYVRTGDFVTAMFEEAHNLDEYAFALGALSHYEADSYGHSLATNKAVPLEFPRLRKKYGDTVTYEQGTNQHSRMEFGFDVVQTAMGNYKSDAYHDFIGFTVCDSVLDRAFQKTYGLSLKNVFKDVPAAIAVFRYAVKTLIPEFTKDAWKIKNAAITQLNPLATQKNYRYSLKRHNYRKEFTQPTFQSVFISIMISILPKVGPLSHFKPKLPDAQSEKYFVESFNAIVAHYSSNIEKLKSKDISLINFNIDTGKKTVMGDYKLADNSYYKLLIKLKKNKFAHTNEGLKKNLEAYYQNRDASRVYGEHSCKGKKLTGALQELQTTSANQDLKSHTKVSSPGKNLDMM